MISYRVSVEGRVQLEGAMKKTIFRTIFEFSRLAILSLALTVNASAFAQKKQAAKDAEPQSRLTFAISEGGSGNLTATDVLFRYEEFNKKIVEKALGTPVTLVAVRDIRTLRRSVASGTYALV